MFLEKILVSKKLEVDALKRRMPQSELKMRAKSVPPVRDFYRAIKRWGPQVNLIAEIKKASPSRGIIRHDFNHVEIARIYEAAGASAISVLTEEKYFQGHPDYLRQVKAVTQIPILRKDFIIDEFQVYESRVLGADAVLLIAAILEPDRLGEFIQLAEELGLAVLVEIHRTSELERALSAGAQAIGINNRDLYTFKTDLAATFTLRPSIPDGPVVVSESGIRTAADMQQLTNSGIDAVLVGEALMQAGDIEATVGKLMGGRTDG